MKLWFKIVIVVLVLSVAVGGVFGILKLSDEGKFDVKKISSVAFSVGGLDEQGRYKKTTETLYTKDVFELQGLNCEPEFDSGVVYWVYFYAENGNFLNHTPALSGKFSSESIPVLAKYGRIVIKPVDEKKVTRLNLLKYASKLKITINREQNFTNPNLFVSDASMAGSMYHMNTGAVTESSAYSCSVQIELYDFSKVKVVFADNSSVRSQGTMLVHFWNGSTWMSSVRLEDARYFTGTTEYFDIPAGATRFAICFYSSMVPPEIYLE